MAETEKPEWVDSFAEAIVTKLEHHHAPQPAVSTQVRGWIALIVAIGGLAYLIHAGRSIGAIETTVSQNARTSARVTNSLDAHVKDAAEVNRDISEILRLHEARTARLEGMAER